MSKSKTSFRVGKVQAYLRGSIWYLCYHENGQRHRPRVGSDRDAARQLAAQINGQIEVGAPAALSFEQISIPELRRRWLDHHEQILRSSVQTISRYRSSTDHFLRFLERRPVRYAAQFHTTHAEEFVRHLRSLKVSPNGHAHTKKRPLMDKGLRFVLECCRALFNYAAKRRHLSPYAENPFRTLEIDRIPIEQCRPIELFSAKQEREFLEICDDWQFPLFLTLMLTGLRPGELSHLVLPDDLDLEVGTLRVRNKPKLGWQVKTRNEREIPLVPVLVEVMKCHLKGRNHGPLFPRRLWLKRSRQVKARDLKGLESEFNQILAGAEKEASVSRDRKFRLAKKFWWDMGIVKEDRIRVEFMRLTGKIGQAEMTAPKMLRHLFATALQEGRVDPLIRNELMGHVASGERNAGYGLSMTAVYTHTRPTTRREQMEEAMAHRPAIQVAREWLGKRFNI